MKVPLFSYMAITHLIFDLSEVLIRGLIGIENTLGELLGMQSDNLLHSFGGKDLRALCKNEITEDEYLKRIIAREKWHCSLQELKKIIRDNFHTIIGNMDEIILKLSENYTLILLSDHAQEWVKYIEEYHTFLQHFSYKSYSFQTGNIKDDMQSFLKLLSDLDVDPEVCIFIDDRKENVETAERCGIKGIVFTDRKQLVAELKNFGIIV